MMPVMVSPMSEFQKFIVFNWRWGGGQSVRTYQYFFVSKLTTLGFTEDYMQIVIVKSPSNVCKPKFTMEVVPISLEPQHAYGHTY